MFLALFPSPSFSLPLGIRISPRTLNFSFLWTIPYAFSILRVQSVFSNVDILCVFEGLSSYFSRYFYLFHYRLEIVDGEGQAIKRDSSVFANQPSERVLELVSGQLFPPQVFLLFYSVSLSKFIRSLNHFIYNHNTL